jgi:hypothetical protein
MSQEFRNLNCLNRISSSSSHNNPDSQSLTTPESPVSKPENPPVKWTPDQLRRTGDLLHEHLESHSVDATVLRPDSAILRRILAYFSSLEDFELYIWALSTKRLGQVRSYAFYSTDAASWPERRAEVAQRHTEHAARLAEWSSADATRLEAENHRREIEDRRRAIPFCLACKNSAIIGTPNVGGGSMVHRYCDCEHVEWVRAERGQDYPQLLTSRAAEFLREELAKKRDAEQHDRWDVHYRRQKMKGMIPEFRALEWRFVGADTDKREQILGHLDAEELRRPEAITQATIDAAVEANRAMATQVAHIK